tara:strand:+ start:1048 stop:1236 length:189 start_codon:yes stop_codon:yes gene_type:complete
MNEILSNIELSKRYIASAFRLGVKKGLTCEAEAKTATEAIELFEARILSARLEELNKKIDRS